MRVPLILMPARFGSGLKERPQHGCHRFIGDVVRLTGNGGPLRMRDNRGDPLRGLAEPGGGSPVHDERLDANVG